MQKNLNLSSKLYICLIILAAVFFAVKSIYTIFWDMSYLIGAASFLILIILSNLMPVKLPKGGSVTITYAIHIAAILNYGPFISIIAEITTAIINLILKKDKKYAVEIFDASQFIISIYSIHYCAAMGIDCF